MRIANAVAFNSLPYSCVLVVISHSSSLRRYLCGMWSYYAVRLSLPSRICVYLSRENFPQNHPIKVIDAASDQLIGFLMAIDRPLLANPHGY